MSGVSPGVVPGPGESVIANDEVSDQGSGQKESGCVCPGGCRTFPSRASEAARSACRNSDEAGERLQPMTGGKTLRWDLPSRRRSNRSQRDRSAPCPIIPTYVRSRLTLRIVTSATSSVVSINRAWLGTPPVGTTPAWAIRYARARTRTTGNWSPPGTGGASEAPNFAECEKPPRSQRGFVHLARPKSDEFGSSLRDRSPALEAIRPGTNARQLGQRPFEASTNPGDIALPGLPEPARLLEGLGEGRRPRGPT